MSTENNLQTLYENSVKILADLIAFKTISGEDNNSLINYCDEILKKLGATSFKTFDNEKKRVNLFATLKSKKSNGKKPIILSGHTDVVPVSIVGVQIRLRQLLKGINFLVVVLVI